MQFERTRDYELIAAIITHEKLWPWLTDDFSPAREDYRPAENEAIRYVLVSDAGELLGMFIFIPESEVCWTIHTCLLPHAFGPRAAEAALGVVAWVWANSGCMRITTNVPKYNRLARRFALAAGMAEYGVNPKSYRKHGKLHDQALLGMSRPTEES
jgi:RimJ/RimL family protein N-acetyltransferase